MMMMMLWLPCSPECEALNVQMLLHVNQNERTNLETSSCMLIVCLSWSAGATEQQQQQQGEEGRRRGKGKREGEEGRRRGKEDIPRSVRRQPKEAIQEHNYSQKTILNDADRWKVHKFHLHRCQQDHGLLDRNKYVCQHPLIISWDLSAGYKNKITSWAINMANCEHGQHQQQ